MKEINKLLVQTEYLKKHNWLKAVQLLTEATKKYPDSYELWQELASIYIDNGNEEQTLKLAKDCLIKVIKLKPDNDDAYFKLGNCWLTLGNNGKSINCYLKVKDKYPEAKYNIAIAYSNLNLLNEAAEELSELILDNNVSEPAYLFLADIYINEKEFDKALTVLEKMEKKFGTNGEMLYRTGMCNLYKSYFLKAYVEFEKAHKLRHTSAKFFHAFGIAAEKIGKIDEAIEYLTKSIEISPSASFAYRDLINLYIQKKQLKRALKLANEASKYPDIATFISLLRQKLLFLLEEEDKEKN